VRPSPQAPHARSQPGAAHPKPQEMHLKWDLGSKAGVLGVTERCVTSSVTDQSALDMQEGLLHSPNGKENVPMQLYLAVSASRGIWG